MRRNQIVAIILALAMALSLCGCGDSSRGPTSYEVPYWVTERSGRSAGTDKSAPSSVNFYYDNTRSMYPFVCNKAGQSSVNGKAAVSGTLVNWMNAVREILKLYDGTTYTLQKDGKDVLRWFPYEGDFRNYFSNKSFYTFEDSDGALPMDGDAKVGPLAQLYYPTDAQTFDPTALNIVLTDLAEQSVNNTELAAHINHDILSQDGYAAAVIAVECPFHGTAYVTDPDNISRMLSQQVDGDRPLYMIITGPEDRLQTVYNSLISAMNVQGMEEGEKYYTTVQSAQETVNRVEQIYIPPTLVESGKNSFKKYVENSVFYDNFALEKLDPIEAARLFGGDDFLDVDMNVFRYAKAKGSDRMVLNYYIPLPEYSENYVWRLAMDKQDDLDHLNSADAVQLMEKKDYLTYDYVTFEEVEVTEGEDASAAEEQEENRDTKSRRKKRPKTTKQTVVSWYNQKDGQQTTLLDFAESFSVEATLIGPDEITEELLNGAKLKDSKGNVVDTSGEKRRGANSYELDEKDTIDLSASSHWIHLSVENKKDSFDSSMVAFDLPIYAYISNNRTMPAWVDRLNVTAADISSSAYYDHTFNLSGFYSTLFGVNTQSSSEVHQAECEVKIADIVTVIDNLPTSKKKR